jgi:hypothetical protein
MKGCCYDLIMHDNHVLCARGLTLRLSHIKTSDGEGQRFHFSVPARVAFVYPAAAYY